MRARDLHRKRDVFPDGLVDEQLEILKDDAEVAAQCGHAIAAQPVHADAVHGDLAGRGLRLAIEQAQQAGFPGSRVADEKDELAFCDLEADVIEGAHAVRVDERDAAEGDHRCERSFPEGAAYTFAMNFDLTDEQKAIQSLAREFAQNEVRPRAEEMDREERFPYDLVKKMAELGFMGLPFPEEYGGAGADTVSYALAVMEIARADASTAITMAAHVSLGATPFYLFGTEAQKRALSRPAARKARCCGDSA